MEPEFSVVISCYFEENSIDEFASRLFATIASIDATFEVIFVDDGSDDGTWDRLRAIYENNPLVTAVARLFANSGQAAAITAGLGLARGRSFVLLDSDLQLDPEDLPLVVAKFREGYDVVSGYRADRGDPLLRKIYSRVANAIMRRASGAALRDFGCTFKIFDGRLVRAFGLGPQHVFHLVEVLSKSRRWADVAVHHHQRRYGSSDWTLAKLLDLNTDNVVAITRRRSSISRCSPASEVSFS